MAKDNIHIVKKALCKKEKEIVNPVDFLFNYIETDLRKIKKLHSISTEATMILLHSIFCMFFKSTEILKKLTWETSQNRLDWEIIFITQIINKSLKGLEDMQELLSKDDRLSEFPFILDLIEIQGNQIHDLSPFCTSSWRNREVLNIENILLALNEEKSTNQIVFLKFTLEKIDYICELKNLLPLVDLLTSITKNIEGKLPRKALKDIKISEYLEKFTNGI